MAADLQQTPAFRPGLRPEPQLTGGAANRRMMGNDTPRRPPPTTARIARRRLAVALTKWALPVMAVLLLASIAAWPELDRIKRQSQVALRRVLSIDPETGRMMNPHYRGVDQRGRPYTVTASTAQQVTEARVDLVQPKGDVITEAGTWIMVQALEGTFIQHKSLLDLSKDVVLYREDGTTLYTDTAALDLKAGAAASEDKTHAEGPFGTLDAQGFTLTEKGAVIQFQGPAHLVLNGSEK